MLLSHKQGETPLAPSQWTQTQKTPQQLASSAKLTPSLREITTESQRGQWGSLKIQAGYP